ncbi:MAG: 6-phosphofructokinase 1 [Deltaproteobacteria bacterium ADurb.Bin510]|nr:MAG: 6-phosphofructokinase 1 [Deltaproteobacteria bacterium ADurb.Bin510]
MDFKLISGDIDTTIKSLGKCRVDSPVRGAVFVDDRESVLIDTSLNVFDEFKACDRRPATLEVAGPRSKIFFDPSKTKCGIVTCGGLCPGINDVIRGIVLELFHVYGVKNIYGIPFGLQGFIPHYRHELIELTPTSVGHIHERGGTVLGSSRGGQDPTEIVDAIERLNINLVFFIGGDGTLKAASAVSQEVIARGFKCAVVGIPKTIDNDINFVAKTFGFDTAVEEAKKIIQCAHVEATGAPNGLGLVKLMGRDSGFIAAHAALAQRDVNLVLVPEEDFDLEGEHGLLKMIEQRLQRRGHGVVVVAEGAGSKYFASEERQTDASGNVKQGDIGVFLKNQISAHFKALGVELNLKYIDPSYIIRSVPANASDSVFCNFLAQMAVHAGMSGKTDMLIGLWNNTYVHIPIALATRERKKIDPNGALWRSVLESTGQPCLINDCGR